MRRAVDEILAYNRPFLKRSFGPESLRRKLARLTSSPFGFYRGAFHLFAHDLVEGPFRRWPAHPSRGPVIGDLHTENFGTFRAVSGDIVYDINDFDETTRGPYEFDLRRLAASIVLGATGSGVRLGDGLNAAEVMIRAYIDLIVRMGRVRRRREFQQSDDEKAVHRLLNLAAEKARVEFLQGLVVESTPGVFLLRPSGKYPAIPDSERERVREAVPGFLKNCLAPVGANVRRYRFQDAAFRYAGNGSLGRNRYAALLSKGRDKRETIASLRLMEFKDSLDSAFDQPRPHASRNRAAAVARATESFQLFPKRYIGYTAMGGSPIQTREIGANDARFEHKQFKDGQRLETAARVFGQVTARAHLLASLGKEGPRRLPHDIAGREDRYVHRLLAFAAAYAEQASADFEEFVRGKEKVAAAWNI